jgi:hypothetical protein
MAFSLDRIRRTVPELDESDKRSGVTFVNILFGLVVTTAAIQFSAEFVNWWADGWDFVNKTRLANLAVALTLTVLSWIGYHQSQQYPPFLIKFINIPFFQILPRCVDGDRVLRSRCRCRESRSRRSRSTHTGCVTRSGPRFYRVRALRALGLFGLSVVSRPRVFQEAEDPREPERLGPRRWVTFGFTVAAGIQALAIWVFRPSTGPSVIGADAAIIAFLLLYRLLKQGFDPKVKTRSQVPMPSPVASE